MEHTELGVRDAVVAAIDYIKSLAPLLPTEDLRLEETTRDDNDNWHITMSWKDPGFKFVEKRDYKTIEIDSVTGKVIAMKIRNPFAAAS